MVPLAVCACWGFCAPGEGCGILCWGPVREKIRRERWGQECPSEPAPRKATCVKPGFSRMVRDLLPRYTRGGAPGLPAGTAAGAGPGQVELGLQECIGAISTARRRAWGLRRWCHVSIPQWGTAKARGTLASQHGPFPLQHTFAWPSAPLGRPR